MKPESIADPLDPRIEAYRAVRDPQWLRERGLFLAEGRSVVRLLLAAPRFEIRSVLLTEPAWSGLRETFESSARELRVYVASTAVLRETSGVHFHQGCIAEARAPAEPPLAGLIEDCARSRSPLVVLERLSDPDNVGSVFRNARAFGVGAVLLSPGCASPLYRKALRTSLGAALQIPFATDAGWPGALAALGRAGFTRLALAPAAQDLALADFGTSRPCPALLALLFGSEGDGLTPAALRACEAAVRIPMAELADSVNVATASGIALHHFFAQRSAQIPRPDAPPRPQGDEADGPPRPRRGNPSA